MAENAVKVQRLRTALLPNSMLSCSVVFFKHIWTYDLGTLNISALKSVLAYVDQF